MGAGGTIAAAITAAGLPLSGTIVGVGITLFGVGIYSLGATGTAILFGGIGAGLTGWKLTQRWGNLEEFSFEPLAKTVLHRSVTMDIPATSSTSVTSLDAAIEAGNGTVANDVLVQGVNGIDLVVHGGSQLQQRQCLVTEQATVVRYQLLREVATEERFVHLAIFATGWLHKEDDFTKPWVEAAQLCLPSSGHLAIRWETQCLLSLNKMFADFVASEIASSVASYYLKSCVPFMVKAGSCAALTAAWPVAIIAAMADLDNAWLVCSERARLAGQCLAHVLADRQRVGQRPVTLVGHSMGARLILYCMLELYKLGEFNVVDDVILLGTPSSTRASKWRKVRAAAWGA